MVNIMLVDWLDTKFILLTCVYVNKVEVMCVNNVVMLRCDGCKVKNE